MHSYFNTFAMKMSCWRELPKKQRRRLRKKLQEQGKLRVPENKRKKQTNSNRKIRKRISFYQTPEWL